MQDLNDDNKKTEKPAKAKAPRPLLFLNRTQCVERALALVPLDVNTANAWRHLLRTNATYTRGVPVAQVVTYVERLAAHEAEPQGYFTTLRDLETSGKVATALTAAFAQLQDEGLVKLGFERRDVYDADTKEFVERDVRWIWPIPVEGWPEKWFLAGIALRLDDAVPTTNPENPT
jgi:hypothetical protein